MIIERFIKMMPQRFTVAGDDNWVNGVIIDVDEQSGKARDITRLNYKAAE